MIDHTNKKDQLKRSAIQVSNDILPKKRSKIYANEANQEAR